MLVAFAIYSPCAFPLSCDDVALLLDAGTPVPIVAETVRAASPLPTLADMECLRRRGVDAGTIRALSDAAGVPSKADEHVAPAAHPQLGVRVDVTGMDAPHAQRASEAGSTFRQRISTYRRGVCASLEDAEFAVDVHYSSDRMSTSIVVSVAGMPATPVRPYPGGRMMSVSCVSVVAAAACTSWLVPGALIRQELAGDELLFRYVCDAYGAEPSALSVAIGNRLSPIPIFRPSAWEVLLESPKALPDGTPNGTAQLIKLVGEAGLP